MDANPWLWDVQQVAHFFRHDAADLIQDMPNARLPDVDRLASTLEENDVAGSVLLSGVVDTAFLKDDCGVKSLGMRSAVIYCITKLKKLATTFENQAEAAGPAPDTPQSIPAQLPLAQLPLEQQQTPFPSFDASAGGNVRAGEVEVQDDRGRKRRKLNLLETVKPLQQTQPSKPAAFFGDKGLPVDDLFYGDTLLGEEIRTSTLKSDNDVVMDENDDCNFSFQNQHKLPGECEYVYTQMRRYLMQNEEDMDLKRHDRHAIAMIPYRERLQAQNKPKSVTVFQMVGTNAIAVRENAAYLASGNDYSELEQPQDATAGTTEWDYLLEKWRTNAHDKEIAINGESETETVASSVREGASSDGEEMAEVEEDGEEMTLRDRLDAVMDQFFEELAATWKQKKLPKLEENKAWSVWKKMKKSRSMQESLLDASKSRIEHLYTRLKNYKDWMRNEVWSSEADVRSQCSAMQPTVEDIEFELWKMDVWKRKKEPSHVVQHGHHTAAGSRQSNAASTGTHLHVRPNDRLSVEPADVPADVLMGGEEDDAFHSAQSSPVQIQDEVAAGQQEEHDAADEMSDNDNFVVDDDEQAVMDPSDVDMSSPTDTKQQSQQGDSVLRSSPSTVKSQCVKESGSAQKSEINGGSGTESDLPSPMSFFGSQVKPEMRTPTKLSSSTVQMSDPIEISSDSTPAKVKRGRKKGTPNKKVTYSQRPEDDTADDVASWALHDLVKNQDRKRILIKLLTEIGASARIQMLNAIRMKRIPGFCKLVMERLRSLQHASFLNPTDGDNIVPLAAKLYLAVNYPDRLREIMDATGPLNIDLPWNSILQDSEQVRTHVSMLQNFLEKRRLFQLPKPAPKSSPSNIPSSQIISILDSSDEDEDQDTPKKRKKRIALGNKAQQSQAAAFERQKRFKILESQASNSQDLQAMIQSDPSMSTIPINEATKDEDQDFIFIDKRMALDMKEHQINGVRFMWRELTAQGDDGGQGCILAHTMGLGKTMQTIATLIAINEAAQSLNRRVNVQIPEHLRPDEISGRQLRMLVLCPPQLITNWCCEIDKWASHVFKNVYTIEGGSSEDHRISQMRSWHKVGGVLITGYQLFLAMVDWRAKGDKFAKAGPQYDKYLLESPEIVIADEAHNLKNDKAAVSKAARKIHTESRIGLTGTPMSNDVDEIYSLISFVAPDFLGERRWFTQQYSRPIKDGNSLDSTRAQKRRSIKKLAVLHRQIEPKVNRADITVLRGSLRSKVEYAVTMPLTQKQDASYRKFLAVLQRDEDKDTATNVQIFSWLAVLTLLLNHPVTFKRKLLAPVAPKKAPKRKVESGEPLREPTPGASDSGSVTPAVVPREVEDADEAAAWDKVGDIDDTLRVLGFSDETIDHLISEIDDTLDPALSSKMAMLMTILQLSKQCNDKVLVFTSSIPTLDYVAQLLNSRGFRCGRIDGKVATNKRQQIVEDFNRGFTDVMIISTRAGGVGLNIQAANRVVILDSGFNPAHEEQAIGRAYRLGQEKPVFVYRLIIGGTFEDEVYNKQRFKQSLTSRVVDKKNPKRSATADTREWLFEPKDVPQDTNLQEWLGKDEQVLDKILKKQINAGESSESGPAIRSLITTETLQEDAKDEPLNEDEEREVQEEFAASLTSRIKGKKVGTMTASQTAMPPPTAPQGRSAPRAAKTALPAQSGLSKMVTLKTPHGLPGPSTMPSFPASHGHPLPNDRNRFSDTRPSSTQSGQRAPHGLP